MLRKFHICIMGFTQDTSRESGMEKLWRKLRDQLSLDTHCLVHPQTWDADFDALAEFIFRNGGPQTTVNIYAYSWGAGRGAVALTKALHKRGIQVPRAVLCDPVYHSWVRFYRGVFHASLNPPIVLPANVWRVDSFYQRQNTPQGTSIVLKNKVAQQSDPVQLNYNHQYIDDAPEFHDKVIEVATRPVK